MPYTADKPPLPETADQLRARIPGWGVDRDPRDRPSVPRESRDLEPSGVHWTIPEQQPELRERERSIEHARLTPVFGTAQPTRLLSGALRKLAYRRYSEGRAAHWLILIGADRVDAVESHLQSFLSGRPDNPVTETGVLGEVGAHPIGSRVGQGRVDTHHLPLDPVVVAGPWVLGGYLAFRAVRGLVRRTRAA
jgi:hypothetical protein